MTMALCFNCGEIKFGAICPCPQCETTSTGDMSLDIAFSDHHLDIDTLRQFGEVVRTIAETGAEPPQRFWAFIHYVSQNHPQILRVELNPDAEREIEYLLSGLDLPEVTVVERTLLPAQDDEADEWD